MNTFSGPQTHAVKLSLLRSPFKADSLCWDKLSNSVNFETFSSDDQTIRTVRTICPSQHMTQHATERRRAASERISSRSTINQHVKPNPLKRSPRHSGEQVNITLCYMRAEHVKEHWKLILQPEQPQQNAHHVLITFRATLGTVEMNRVGTFLQCWAAITTCSHALWVTSRVHALDQWREPRQGLHNDLADCAVAYAVRGVLTSLCMPPLKRSNTLAIWSKFLWFSRFFFFFSNFSFNNVMCIMGRKAALERHWVMLAVLPPHTRGCQRSQGIFSRFCWISDSDKWIPLWFIPMGGADLK